MQVKCPNCGFIFYSKGKKARVTCSNCGYSYSKFEALAIKTFKDNPKATLEFSGIKIHKPRGGRELSTEVRNEVYERDKGRCVVCGSYQNLEFHHLIERHREILKNDLSSDPRYKGIVIGTHEAKNVVLICQKCHYLHTYWINPKWWKSSYVKEMKLVHGSWKEPKAKQLFPGQTYSALVHKQRMIDSALDTIALTQEPEEWKRYDIWTGNKKRQS
jgi:5-methylcytosine-specific restriction endonuclease McrA